MFPVYIGFDSREAVAFDVCRHSLVTRSSVPADVNCLRQNTLRQLGLYRRAAVVKHGQRFDVIDSKPFATEFSFTRFLVPALCRYEGWALFCDCDFLFMADVMELTPMIDDAKAVLVCKQLHAPTEVSKMDGCVQQCYPRKNWSSFMLFNCSHAAVQRLTVDAVNERPGAWLHGFEWLRDDEIGELPPAWNWMDGVTESSPKAIHYTAGGPWFPDHAMVPFAQEWRDAYAQAYGSPWQEAA